MIYNSLRSKVNVPYIIYLLHITRWKFNHNKPRVELSSFVAWMKPVSWKYRALSTGSRIAQYKRSNKESQRLYILKYKNFQFNSFSVWEEKLFCTKNIYILKDKYFDIHCDIITFQKSCDSLKTFLSSTQSIIIDITTTCSDWTSLSFSSETYTTYI